MSLIAIWWGWTPYTLTPGVQGAQWGSGASWVHFGKNSIKQKLLGTPNLVGVGHLIGPQIQIWKDQGLDSFSRGVYKIKVAVPMSGYPHIILVSNQILSLNTFLIPILNHPGQRQVTQASLGYF